MWNRLLATFVWWNESHRRPHTNTHSRHQKSLKKDPFTCFTRRRIDVWKRSKPSILTIPSGTHLPVTIYQRYWTHRVVPPPLKHFHNVALTAPFSGRITTNLCRAKSWGKSKIFFLSRGLVWRYWNFICEGMWNTWICCGYVIFALVKILQLFKHLYCYLLVILHVHIHMNVHTIGMYLPRGI